jgi:tRNA (cmo5U34)-methyltransferase
MATHQHHEHAAHHDQAGQHGPEDEHRWSDESFVAEWIQRQETRAAERRPLFAKVRALIPRDLSEPFRYADIGAGNGIIDELVLDRYTEAQAVLIDGSAPMLAHARERLARFGERVQYLTADIAQPGWAATAGGPFNIILASRAVHHAGDADSIRRLFGEILGVLAPGGVFVNLDFVRFTDPVFRQLGTWAGEDAEAAFQVEIPHHDLPASLEEQLVWLREAGFAAAECVYREFQTVIVAAVRDELRLPEAVLQA